MPCSESDNSDNNIDDGRFWCCRDRLKSSRAAVRQQGEDNEDDEDEIFLGAEGTPFSFESDSPCDVLFVPCSVVDGSGMEDLQEFIGRAFDEEE